MVKECRELDRVGSGTGEPGRLRTGREGLNVYGVGSVRTQQTMRKAARRGGFILTGPGGRRQGRQSEKGKKKLVALEMSSGGCCVRTSFGRGA